MMALPAPVIPPNFAIHRQARPILLVTPIMKIDRKVPKNRVDRVMRVNNPVQAADHSGDKVGFRGTVTLTGRVRGGTSSPIISLVGASCHVRSRKPLGQSGCECSRRPVEAGWLARCMG